MLEKQKKHARSQMKKKNVRKTQDELVRWYDREDHTLFDVCADDHCQRYQGISKIISDAATQAVDSTYGIFLVHDDEICDARYYKACGGLSDNYENVWDDTSVPYLRSISDSPTTYPAVHTEADAEHWILSHPESYCNTSDVKILKQVLPSFDQETTDFFRWKVEYSRQELEHLIRQKSGIDFGTLRELIPLRRGPSGRIYKMKIVGSLRTVTVGKELEIRKWLSNSHLYSSAFVVQTEKDSTGTVARFILHGAGWGHGVGLCQIGAAVMAFKGIKAEEIVRHYFPGAGLRKLYDRVHTENRST
jgi:stage II sporulation protein D